MTTQYTSDKQLATRFGVSRQSIWLWVRKGKFPKPIKLSESVTRWRLTDVELWEKAREVA